MAAACVKCGTAPDGDPDKESGERCGYPFHLMCGVPSEVQQGT